MPIFLFEGIDEAIERFQLIADCFLDFDFNIFKSVSVFSKFSLLFPVYLLLFLNKDRSQIFSGETQVIWFLVFSTMEILT